MFQKKTKGNSFWVPETETPTPGARFGVLVAMHSLGLGGKPLGSVAKFTELCRSVLGGHVVPEAGGAQGGGRTWSDWGGWKRVHWQVFEILDLKMLFGFGAFWW